MGEKWKIPKEDLKNLFAICDHAMAGQYHEIYKSLGLKKAARGPNFHCFNGPGHMDGEDSKASLSIDNDRGVWHCFACGAKGNLSSYFYNYLAGHENYGNSFTDFLIDLCGIGDSGKILSLSNNKEDVEKNREALNRVYHQISEAHLKKTGKPMIMDKGMSEEVRKISTIPMTVIDAHVERLLADADKMKYLFDTRKIDIKVIKSYKIGLDESGRFIFPIFNAAGDLINMKAYNPFNPKKKWSYPYLGYEVKPTPINNFSNQKIYFFEGEPDMYCAVSFGIKGAVTMGSCAINDVDSVFGKEAAEQLFLGKEIVIIFDSDGPGKDGSTKLAKSLNKYAKQIKIIDLDKNDDINPNGLDPENLKIEIDENGKEKRRRVEKDFTDFMLKNGFGEAAFDELMAVESRTKVYSDNPLRSRSEKYKVTLQEARMPQYFYGRGDISLEVIASVSDLDCNAYMYPVDFNFACDMIGCSKLPKQCSGCKVQDVKEFKDGQTFQFHFVRNIAKEHEGDPKWIKLDSHDMLGLVEVSDSQRDVQRRRLCGINERCRRCKIIDTKVEKLLHVKLAKDVNEPSDQTSVGAAADIDMEAYVVGNTDIYPNKSYRLTATQTTAWAGQYAVLDVERTEPIANAIDVFKMDQETYETLSRTFGQREGESIEDTLKRRYDTFGGAAGLNGRSDLFLINDLTFFSATEIDNKKLLPSVKRGWVESLIFGESRCGKSVASKFLLNHYKVGEMVSGSTAMSRSGLVGGVKLFKGKDRLSWGKIPMNDRGLLIIDELSNVSLKDLSDMNTVRSEGVAEIVKIKAGKAQARTRKIMLSNPREWVAEERNESGFGIRQIKQLCGKDEILSRFDIAFVVKQADVDVNNFTSSYEPITTTYTELQCQQHIRWTWSRRPDEIVFEDGIEHVINEHQVALLKQFHPSTQLVNVEMRAKLVRLSVAAAALLFSHVPGDWNKILVTKEHVNFIVRTLTRLYCHKNMKLDEYSKVIWRTETLGDMRFIASILKVIDYKILIQEEEFNERAIYQTFYDYLEQVQAGTMYMVDALNDGRQSKFRYMTDGVQKLISILISRNCFARTKRGTYRKTPMFTEWLNDIDRVGFPPDSELIDIKRPESGSVVIQEAKANTGYSEHVGKKWGIDYKQVSDRRD